MLMEREKARGDNKEREKGNTLSFTLSSVWREWDELQMGSRKQTIEHEKRSAIDNDQVSQEKIFINH